MNTQFFAADARGHYNHGWLDTWHSFSFAHWQQPDRMRFGMLRVLNDDFVAPGMGFGTHPHDNMEIISIPLSGALAHRDSSGGEGIIRSGEVQVMSAGTGLQHSEYNGSRTEAVNFLQIWIYPAQRNVAPRYEQRAFSAADRKNQLQTLVSPAGGQGLFIHQQAWISRIDLDAGEQVSYDWHSPGHGVYVFMISGSILAGVTVLGPRDAAGITGTDTLELKASTAAEVLLIEVPMHP